MADDLSTITRPKRGVYSDGTDGQAATPPPVMAAQDLSTASALPSTNAQSIVQPPTTLASASPTAPPLAPVAAPAAQAAAAAPVTPNQPAGPTSIGAQPAQTGQQRVNQLLAMPDQDTINRTLGMVAGATSPVGSAFSFLNRATAAGNAAKIRPGATPNPTYDATQAANAALRQPGGAGPAPLNPNMTTGAAPGVMVPPAAPAAAASPAATTMGPRATKIGETPAPGAANLGAAAPDAAKTGNWWSNLSGGQKAAVGAAGLADVVIPAYQAGTPDTPLPPVPGAPDTGTPGSMTGGDPTAGTPYAHAPTSFAQPATSAIGTEPAAPTLGSITRDGNSFSGTNVGAGTSPTPEAAAAAHAAAMQGYANESAYMQDKTARTLAQDEWNGPTPGMVGMDLSRTGGDAYAKFGEDANLRTAQAKGSWSPRKGYMGDETAVKAAMVPVEARQKREAETLRSGNELAKTKLTTQAENARSAATNAITMRGQNITADTARGNTLANLYGSDSKAASEKAKLDYTKVKDDKEYQRTLAKDGREKAEKDWKARNDAQDEVAKRAASMRGPDDKAGAARDAQAVMSHIEDTKAQLEAVVKNNPNNKDAAEQLDNFKRFGARNYDDTQIHNLLKGIQLTEKVNQQNMKDSSFLTRLWKGTQTGVTSNEPFAGVKRIERPNAPDVYVETDASGRPIGRDRKPLKAGSSDYGRVIPASVIEKDEGVFGTGLFAKPSNDFRTLVH